jgi:guanylate kinase
MNAKLVVLSGPSAVGKGTLASHIIEQNGNFELSVSATTRSARPGEIDGRSYRFVSEDEFLKMQQNNELLEWATVHGQHRYGTPRSPVEKALAEGKNVVLEIDVQGGRLSALLLQALKDRAISKNEADQIAAQVDQEMRLLSRMRRNVLRLAETGGQLVINQNPEI